MNRNRLTRTLVHVLVPPVALLLVGAIAFRDFLFGDMLLLYKDIGSDSLNYYYPYLLLFSEYIRDEGLPLWSFRVGMGQTLFPDIGVLVFNPAAWFPGPAIAHLLVYQHLALVLVAGLLFHKFLVLRGLNFRAALTGALLLTFSAYMSMGSCWTICAGEVVCVAFALFALENAMVTGRWIYLPFAVALFALLTAFHLYLGAVLISAYVLARILLGARRGWRQQCRRLVRLAAIAFLGAGLAAVVWVDSLIQIRNSPRGSGTASYATNLASSGVFTLESSLHYFTAVLRSFSNDMVGAGNAYRGWSNYLEAALPYCGLFSLIILPQVFVRASNRQRIAAALFLTSMLVAVIFPWFRYLFYLFQGDYFRAFSLFSVTGTIILSATAFSRYLEKQSLNLWLLLGTLLALLGLLYLPLPEMQKLIDPSLQKLAALLLFTYAALLAAGRLLQRESIFGWLVLILLAAELSYSTAFTVSDRPVVTKQERNERVGFNDYTIEALRAIKADDEGFFRVSKVYSSSAAEHPNLNDSFAFDYYGTSSYVSFNSLNYINFLIALEALPPTPTEFETRWSPGLLGRPLLSTFACEKYVLAQEAVPAEARFGYEEGGHYGNVYVYRNTSFLPLGLFFEDAITEKVFSLFSASGKESLLLQSVVLEDGAFAAELPGQTPPEIDELLESVETKSIPDLIAARRESAFQMRSFSQNRIEGSIRCNKSGFLVFQIPLDPGWRVFVDGERVPPLRVDIGLMGVRLPAGEHQVRLRYLPPALVPGGIATLLSAFALAVGFWRWPRLSPLART